MNVVVQASTYLAQSCSIEQLVNEVGPEIDQEVDEIDELLQILQGQLASFRFAVAPINLKQQAVIQQALDDCAHARAIQGRLATFIASLRAFGPGEEIHDLPERTNPTDRTARE